jgi:arylsulfatase
MKSGLLSLAVMVTLATLALSLTARAQNAPAGDGKKPNIVFILMDNLGYGEVGSYGGGILRGAPTPRIDKLASEGTRLVNFNVEAQCTPSRSAIMTGRFSIRSGTHSVPIGGGLDGLTQWEVTIAELLSGAGYSTGHFGKWHLGSVNGRLPNDQGFDEWYGIPRTTDESFWPSEPAAKAAGVPFMHIMEGHKGEKGRELAVYDLHERRLIDAEITRRTIEFMKRSVQSGKPFYVYVPFTLVHFPTLPNPQFAGKTGFGDFPDGLAEMDGHVGAILDAIDDLRIRDNTVVVFTSDNGPEATHPWQGSSGPWRGYYFTHMEGSLRVHSLSAGQAGLPRVVSATRSCMRSILTPRSSRSQARRCRMIAPSTGWTRAISCSGSLTRPTAKVSRCSWLIVWRRPSGETGRSSSTASNETGGPRPPSSAPRRRSISLPIRRRNIHRLQAGTHGTRVRS